MTTLQRYDIDMDVEDGYDPWYATFPCESGEWVKYEEAAAELSRIEDKYVNLCPVLNEQAGEILDLKEQIAALQSREVCTVAHEDVETCGYCQRDALTRENSSMAMKLAMIATGCYRGDVQEFAGSALDPPAYQGAVTDFEDVPPLITAACNPPRRRTL